MSELQDRIGAALGGRYAVEREIGRGGMAVVFLAADGKHHRQVAVKVLHPGLAAAIGGDRFLREINIAAHLRHPHIVPLLDSGESDGLLYYVMPYVEGESLRQRLAVSGRLEVTEAARYWRDVVDAIAYAHRHAILHRDLKPENVLLADRHASLVDFGIGKFLSQAGEDSSLTAAGMVVGTPAYMAPEQAMATDEIDQRADIYALGVLGYEMLAGRVPFTASTPTQLATKLTAAAPDVREIRPEVPAEFARMIKRCLEPDRDDRWQSAEELLEAVESVATPPAAVAPTAWRRATSTPGRRNGALAAISLLAVALIAFAYVSVSRTREKSWARETGLRDLRRLADAAINDSAFLLASRVRAALPGEPEVDSLLRRVSTTATLHTTPEGARVYWTSYRGDTANWQPLGATPLDKIPVPSPRFGQINLLLKYEKPGYRTSLRPLGIERRATTPVVLDSVTEGETEVRIRGGIVAAPSPTRLAGDSLDLPDFFIDRLEVTNGQFKKFVVAGGYRRRELWDYPFSLPRGELSFDAAMSRFVDKTGRPGPASWQGGHIPQGRENYPVSGISWYEAQAYARFAGKKLPTIFHWRRAAEASVSSWFLPHSNIEGSGLAPVGAFKGMTPYGAADMAGNVREWCVNSNGGNRYILGGSWSDFAYMFTHAITEDPMDRSEFNGVRLMRNLPLAGSVGPRQEGDPFARPSPRGFRDYAAEKPASDAEIRSFLPVFDYDRSPLNAIVEKSDSSDSRWIRQTIAFDAAYGQERVRAYLFLPRDVRPPYQTAVFFPGASTVDARSSKNLIALPDFVVSNGRALLHPIYKDTYERGGNESTPMGTDPVYNMTGGLLAPIAYRDRVVMYVKDLRRAVDYLITRPDVDTAKLAYIGFSWGGRLGPINLSAERRFKAAVFYLPGLNFAPRRREVDEFNYLPQVKLPTLVLSGRYDDVFPLQTSAFPFFERLGTPAAHKRHRVYPTQHFLPRDAMIRETLDWLDRYLGKAVPLATAVGN